MYLYKRIIFICSLIILYSQISFAIEPVNPNLIPEARAVLDYLDSVYGDRCLLGQNSGAGVDVNFPRVQSFYNTTGVFPSIISLDVWGWNKPHWGESFTSVLERQVQGVQDWWHHYGGLVSTQWHWGNPAVEGGTAWVNRTGKVDVGKIVTPGTKAYKAAMEDIRRTADIMQPLLDNRIPVLFRPLHEIDGGWFWWTDQENPENTAKLWRMIYDYFVNERGMNNLIWVYSAGIGDLNPEYRKRFYPGAKYVDIAGIDIYSYQRDLDFQHDAYEAFFDMMEEIAPGKMLALTECDTIPSPAVMKEQGPRWLYSLPWFEPGKRNDPEWVKHYAHHPFLLPLSEVPGTLSLPHNQKTEWMQLFDGETLNGWVVRGGEAKYRVEDNAIVGTTVDGSPNTFLCKGYFRDFILEFDVKCDPDLNSGVQIRSHIYAEETPQVSNPDRMREEGEIYGMQCEIDTGGSAGNFWDEARRTRWLDDFSDKPQARDAYKPGEWNQYRIKAQGNHIQSWINDIPCADFYDDTDSGGFIGLQVHSIRRGTGPYEVRWRNIRLRRLLPAE